MSKPCLLCGNPAIVEFRVQRENKRPDIATLCEACYVIGARSDDELAAKMIAAFIASRQEGMIESSLVRDLRKPIERQRGILSVLDATWEEDGVELGGQFMLVGLLLPRMPSVGHLWWRSRFCIPPSVAGAIIGQCGSFAWQGEPPLRFVATTDGETLHLLDNPGVTAGVFRQFSNANHVGEESTAYDLMSAWGAPIGYRTLKAAFL